MRISTGVRIIALGIGVFAITGCETATTNPVVFGQETSFGLTIGQSAATQTPEFKVGYNDTNVAYLPTVAVAEDGTVTPLGGVINEEGSSYNETYSVLGQFEANAANSDKEQSFALGKFFATGNAAVKLSAGFACGVSQGKDSAHCHKP